MRYLHYKPLLLLVVVFVTAAHASVHHASNHTGYWNGHTPTGKSFECEEVTTEERMKEVLRSAGWNMDDEVPAIDWERDEAVIVAPSYYYESGHLAFYSLYREDDSIVLEYGWDQIGRHDTTTTTTGIQITTLGSSSPGYPATIVVSYRKGLDSGLKFVCRNKKLVR